MYTYVMKGRYTPTGAEKFVLTLTFTTGKDDLVRKTAGENPKTDAVDKSVDSRTIL